MEHLQIWPPVKVMHWLFSSAASYWQTWVWIGQLFLSYIPTWLDWKCLADVKVALDIKMFTSWNKHGLLWNRKARFHSSTQQIGHATLPLAKIYSCQKILTNGRRGEGEQKSEQNDWSVIFGIHLLWGLFKADIIQRHALWLTAWLLAVASALV